MMDIQRLFEPNTMQLIGGLLVSAGFLFVFLICTNIVRGVKSHFTGRKVKRFAELLDDMPFEPTNPPLSAKSKRTAVNGTRDMADEIERIVASMPNIRQLQEVMKTVPRNMRQQLSGVLGQEVMRALTQGTANELAAVIERRKDELKTALALNQADLAARSSVVITHRQLAILRVMQEVAADFRGELDGPYEREAARIMAREIARVQAMYANLLAPYQSAGYVEEFLPPPQIDDQSWYEFDQIYQDYTSGKMG